MGYPPDPAAMHFPCRSDGVVDDVPALLEATRRSNQPVAVYDMSEPAILAASDSACMRMGFTDVDAESVDIVAAAKDPDRVRQVVELIRDGQLQEWKWRSWLYEPTGEGYWDVATGIALETATRRRLGFVRYPSIQDPARSPSIDCSPRDTLPDATSVTVSLTVELAAAWASGWNGVAARMDLSERQRYILTRLLRGERAPAIAKTLYLSPSTVRNHLSAIYRKFGVKSHAELIDALIDRPVGPV
jgi:DNA-binding CsgD family transcriptional regulator